MAQNNKFRLPEVTEQSDRSYANPPPKVEEAPFLREIANPSIIHVYSKEMAARGDLVEAYWPPKPEAAKKARSSSRKSGVKTSADSQPAAAPVQVPTAPPLPPSIPAAPQPPKMTSAPPVPPKPPATE